MNEIVYIQEYSRSYNPPMPVMDIGISQPDATSPQIFLETIVDTGADGTLLPVDVLEGIQARVVDRARLVGITGRHQIVDLYVVTIQVGSVRLPGIKVAALPQGATGILGRDVLNQLLVHLNGPALVLELAG